MYTKITISGKICTGKSTLFKDLQKQLGWPTYSAGQFFRDYVKKHGMSLEKAEEQTPKLTKEVDYGMQEMLKTKTHIILEGWMTGIMAAGLSDVLRVLLTSDNEIRAKRFAKRESVDLETAKERINERESSLFKKLAEIYSRNDFVDPKNYNLVIDTTGKTPAEVLQTVLSKLQ